jgi:hypothetical protein
MELLCRHRAVFDAQHSEKWLCQAERWKDIAHREAASRFHATWPSPMAIGANTVESDRRAMRKMAQLDHRKTPLE